MKEPKKSLGQNFLIDQNIINKIIKQTNIKDENIVEIGPGYGSLTDHILRKKPKKLIIIEKDLDIFKFLEESNNWSLKNLLSSTAPGTLLDKWTAAFPPSNEPARPSLEAALLFKVVEACAPNDYRPDMVEFAYSNAVANQAASVWELDSMYTLYKKAQRDKGAVLAAARPFFANYDTVLAPPRMPDDLNAATTTDAQKVTKLVDSVLNGVTFDQSNQNDLQNSKGVADQLKRLESLTSGSHTPPQPALPPPVVNAAKALLIFRFTKLSGIKFEAQLHKNMQLQENQEALDAANELAHQADNDYPKHPGPVEEEVTFAQQALKHCDTLLFGLSGLVSLVAPHLQTETNKFKQHLMLLEPRMLFESWRPARAL